MIINQFLEPPVSLRPFLQGAVINIVLCSLVLDSFQKIYVYSVDFQCLQIIPPVVSSKN